MLLQILLLLAGLALVVYGSNFLVDGASALARRWGLSEFVIGLTIVGMGTSAPEMVVSFIGAAEGSAGISVGNVIGSNIFNTLLILGLTALLLPIAITPENRKRDIPVNIGATVLLLGLGYWGGLSRWDGAILVACFALYMGWSFRKEILHGAQNDKRGAQNDDCHPEAEGRRIWIPLLMALGGLGGLILGGRLFVDSAVAIARAAGVSDKFIAITILAGGTSLPELATCVSAAVKKKGQLALGNIIGSNIFNILLILGGSALIRPLPFSEITSVDLLALLGSALVMLLAAFSGKKNTLDRWEGGVFVLLFAGYMTYLLMTL